MDEIIANQNLIQESTYEAARNSVINAQRKVYAAVNNSMVQAYWEIGEQIYKACGETTEQNMVKISFNICQRNFRQNLEKDSL